MSNPDYLKMIAGLCDAMKRLEWAVSTSGADRKSYIKHCKRKRSLVEGELVKAAGQIRQGKSDADDSPDDVFRNLVSEYVSSYHRLDNLRNIEASFYRDADLPAHIESEIEELEQKLNQWRTRASIALLASSQDEYG